jgi:hypothetical protein
MSLIDYQLVSIFSAVASFVDRRVYLQIRATFLVYENLVSSHNLLGIFPSVAFHFFFSSFFFTFSFVFLGKSSL